MRIGGNPAFVPVPPRRHGLTGFWFLIATLVLTLVDASAPLSVPGFEEPLRGKLDEVVILDLGGCLAMFAFIVAVSGHDTIG